MSHVSIDVCGLFQTDFKIFTYKICYYFGKKFKYKETVTKAKVTMWIAKVIDF